MAGAGPAGLAAALFMHRAGCKVTIFEQFDAPKPVGSGLILQPTGLTVLDKLGLLGAIMALGARIDRLFGQDALSRRTVLDVSYVVQKRGRFGLAVHRAALFSVLFKAVQDAGITVATAARLTDIEPASAGIAVVSENGQRIGGFDLVVDASGARSLLRRHAVAPSAPTPLTYGAFWATLNWPADGFAANTLSQRYDKASVMIGVMPIGRASAGGNPKAAFFWSLKPQDAGAIQAAGLVAWKERVLSMWPECAPLMDQLSNWGQLTLARYGHHTISQPVGPRLAIVGDAAHSTSPQLGQGANMALLDACALAHAIEVSTDMETALGAYAAARRLHVRVFQTMSKFLTPLYQSDSTFLPFVRDRLVATAAKVPPAPGRLASLVAGTIVDPLRPIGLTETDWNKVRGDAPKSQVR